MLPHERAFIELNRVKDLLESLNRVHERFGWAMDDLSHTIFKEVGVYELYDSDYKLDGRFISDLIIDRYARSQTVEEVYQNLTYILFDIEFHNGLDI